jgi:hypothetical protein
MRKNTKILISLIFLMAVVFPLISPFVGMAWKPINCRYEDIDLETGRIRYTTMVYWIPISRRIEHTSISEVLGVADLYKATGDWRRVNTFSPGVRHSPHYSFHGVLSQIQILKMTWELENFDAKNRKESARELLRLWKTSGSDSNTDDFFTELSSYSYSK